MTLQDRLRQMADYHEGRECQGGVQHSTWAFDSREAADRIAVLEAALRKITNPTAWSFVQVDNEASNILNQQLGEMQRIAAEALRN